jgi:hypothetical protein
MPLSLVVSHLVVYHLVVSHLVVYHLLVVHHLLVVYLSLALKLMEWLVWLQRWMQESMQW